MLRSQALSRTSLGFIVAAGVLADGLFGAGCSGSDRGPSSQKGGAASGSGPAAGGAPGANPGFPGLPGGGTSSGTTGQPTATQPGTNFAFVSSLGGGAVDIFDVATGLQVSSVAPGAAAGAPTDVGIDPQKTAVYVADAALGALLVYDPLTYAPRGTVDLSTAPLSQYPLLALLDPMLRMAYAPMGVAVAPNGKAYVPAMISVTVVENGVATKGILDLDLASPNPSLFDLLLANVESLGAFRAAATPNGTVLVTNFFSDTVTAIDTATDAILATIPVGRGPAGIAVDPRGIAYVCCAFSGEVWTIDTRTNQVGQAIPAGIGPIDVACDALGRNVYVTNYLSGDVTVIDALAHVPVATLPASSMTSLLNALGLSPQAMQAMLNQLLTGFGAAGAGSGSSAGGLSTFFGALSGTTGASGPGGAIAAMMQQLLNAFFAQLGGGSGGLPVAGVWGVAVSAPGDRIVVANAVTGEVSFVDPWTATHVASAFPGLASGAGLPFPGVASVEILAR